MFQDVVTPTRPVSYQVSLFSPSTSSGIGSLLINTCAIWQAQEPKDQVDMLFLFSGLRALYPLLLALCFSSLPNRIIIIFLLCLCQIRLFNFFQIDLLVDCPIFIRKNLYFIVPAKSGIFNPRSDFRDVNATITHQSPIV